MSFVTQFAKFDTLAATLNSGATSTTLTTGNFGSPTGVQLYVVDYDVPAKSEIISASITTTAVTGITRGLSGGAAGTTDHAAGAKIGVILVPQHYAILSNSMVDGWVDAGLTWTYASATTFTITGDLTSVLSKGDKLRMTNTGTKYFYVTGVSYSNPTTTVTVTGGTDYTLANAAITVPFYSKAASPNGFPGYFNYTSTWTADSVNPVLNNGSLTSRFSMTGIRISLFINLTMGTTTTYGTGTWHFTVPVTANTMELGIWSAFRDGGTNTYSGSVVSTDSSKVEMWAPTGTYVAVTQNDPFVWAGGNDVLRLTMSYYV